MPLQEGVFKIDRLESLLAEVGTFLSGLFLSGLFFLFTYSNIMMKMFFLLKTYYRWSVI